MILFKILSTFLIFVCCFENDIVNAYEKYFDKKYEFEVHSGDGQIKLQNLTPYKLTLNAQKSSVVVEAYKTEVMNFDPNQRSTVQLNCNALHPRFVDNYDFKILYSRIENSDKATIKLECDSNFAKLVYFEFNKETATLTLTSLHKKEFNKEIRFKSSGGSCEIGLKNLTPYKLDCTTKNLANVDKAIELKDLDFDRTGNLKFSAIDLKKPATLEMDCTINNNMENTLNLQLTKPHKRVIIDTCKIKLTSLNEDFSKQPKIAYNSGRSILFLSPKE